MASLKQALPAVIDTDRLVLRAPMLADLTQLVALANNRAVSDPTAALPFPYGEPDGRAFIETFCGEPDQHHYALIDKAGHFIGVIGFKLVEGAPPELGYWLGQPFWGQGYVPEAAAALLAAAAATGLVPAINARVLASNPASARVLEKCGFTVMERTVSVVERHRGKPLLILHWQAP